MLSASNMTISDKKANVRVERFSDLNFVPRFEYGDMAQGVEICGENDGSELGSGWGRLTEAYLPWTIKYDEVLTVFEGQLKLHANGQVHVLNPKDAIWLPSGTALIYEAESVLIHYAIHPSNWHEST
jgi:ethanolamine utilization protein EutQ